MSDALRRIGGDGGSCHVVCFPYAGAGSDAFAGLQALCPIGVDLWAVDLAGRLRRGDESAVLSFGEAVDDLACALVDKFGEEPLVFYGHSMGGYLAVETARRLEHLGCLTVMHVIVGACASPDHVDFSRFGTLASADDATLLDVVKGWGLPAPKGLLASPAAVAVALHALRLDLALLSTYQAHDQARLATPISALRGTMDSDVQLQQCLDWFHYTTAWGGVRICEGGHLFLATHAETVVEALIPMLVNRCADHD